MSTLDPPPPDPRYAAALAKQKADREAAKQKAPRRRPILRIVGGTDYETKTQEAPVNELPVLRVDSSYTQEQSNVDDEL